MSTLALTTAFAYVGSHDYTGDSNEWNLSGEADAKECTNFRSGGWREYKMGPKRSNLSLSGHYDTASNSDAPDPHVFDNLGVASQVISTGVNETEATTAYIHRGMEPTFSILGSYGEITPFSLTALGDDGPTGVVKGQLALKKTTVSTTGAKGTACNLGLVAASRYLYASLHLFGTAATSITALIESDDNQSFTTPTTRITFGPITASGGFWGTRVAGAIASDTWWRINVSAITGSWSAACVIAIGN